MLSSLIEEQRNHVHLREIIKRIGGWGRLRDTSGLSTEIRVAISQSAISAICHISADRQIFRHFRETTQIFWIESAFLPFNIPDKSEGPHSGALDSGFFLSPSQSYSISLLG